MPATEESVRLLTGWGRTAPTRARVLRPASAEQAAALLAGAGPRGGLPRGLGRSYGDAAQNAGGDVLDMTALDRIGRVERGVVELGGGAGLEAVIRALLPQGWFVPVTPGTVHVTAGGAVAADVHGKNHHRDSSFGRHLLGLTLATPSGELVEAGPRRRPELFAATVGGMGLTGAVVALRVELIPVESSWIAVDTARTHDLEDTMAELAAADSAARYSVAWVDLVVGGARLGRGIVQHGDHASCDQLGSGREPLALPSGRRIAAPPAPPGLMGRRSARAFNELWYRRAPRRRHELMPLTAFFHPLDGLDGWSRLYGPAGLVQHQLVVPFGQEPALVAAVELLHRRRCPVCLAVLKRFGEGSAGMLSFPMPGWTLAVDVPAAWSGLGALLDDLDELVCAAAGRVYLAKDARLSPERFRQMYPQLDRFLEQRAAVDPGGRLRSDLGRRLGLSR
ncbi:MAG TPA: FAD-binding oxidoreductase [Gaiellales bacterium]|nr:FAD-binding oxidoreductase [Gaiellales bacterium]